MTPTAPGQAQSQPTELGELLEAVAWHVANAPSEWWVPAIRDAARRVADDLASRLHRLTAEDLVAGAVPCAHSWCRHEVALIDDVPQHVPSNGTLLSVRLTLGIPTDDGDGYHFIRHDAIPAHPRRQAELQAIVERAVPCEHPLCDHNVAVVGGVLQHIDDNGKLLCHRITIPTPDSTAWAPHEATLAAATGETK